MPVTPTYPGVYIEEVPSGVHTITGVATSIAAFFGRTAKGPINKAVRCLSMSDFIREFGGPHPSSNLAQSVRQFFDNGGTDCYVVRLAHNARKADIILRNLADDTNVLKATAKHAGNWGNGVHLEVDYNTPNPDETFNLKVIHEEGGTVIASESFTNLSMNPNSPRYAPLFVTQSSRIIDLDLAPGFDIDSNPVVGYSESRRPFDTDPPAGTALATALNALVHPADPADLRSRFEISVNDSPYIPIDLRADPTWVPFTGDATAIAVEITNRINTQLSAVVTGLAILCTWVNVHDDFSVLRISSDVNARSSVRIRRSPTNDLAGPLMLGIDQGGIEVVRYSNHRPVPTATVLTGNINTLAAQLQSAFNQIVLSGTIVNLGTDLQTTAGGERWYRDNLASDVNNHNDGVREKLRIIAKKVNDDPNVTCRAEVWGYHLAFIPTKGTINSTTQVSSQGGDGINIGTLFTPNVRQYALGATGTSDFQDGFGTIGQDDDGNPPDVSDYVGSEADHTGFHALDRVDIFNLMVLPGDRDISEATHLQLWGPASIYCQQKRAFLLMDAPDSWTNVDRPVATNVEVNSLRALVVKDHSSVFYPKVQYSDAGIKKLIGPSGIIAGLMARIDSTRGVWKAPAGTEADLRGVLDLEVNLTDRENGVLNKLGVNCLRKFPSGIVNWGSRTMDGADDIGSEWKYIPIRRLALFIEESLFRGTKWVVFEPNDEPLWAKIRLNVGAFMMRLFRQGAFQGSTPDQAFYVKCDAETTTQADRNLGIVNIEVGFAPLKPAEFVIIKIQQIAGQL
ncbi:MAG: phage tail sheath subtilisin-like domain-containing protein [Nitrospirota bacterium]